MTEPNELLNRCEQEDMQAMFDLFKPFATTKYTNLGLKAGLALGRRDSDGTIYIISGEVNKDGSGSWVEPIYLAESTLQAELYGNPTRKNETVVVSYGANGERYGVCLRSSGKNETKDKKRDCKLVRQMVRWANRQLESVEE